MKINLYVDVGYAIDFLSILEVKFNKLKDEISLDNLNFQKKFLSKQINVKLFDRILNSPEYKDLYITNEKIWDSINLIKSKKITAKKIDDLNYRRWIIKNKLQKKFFKKDTSEQKTKRT